MIDNTVPIFGWHTEKSSSNNLTQILNQVGTYGQVRIVNYVTQSQALPYSALSCIRYFMQGKDIFRVILGMFGITLANRGIFGVGIFTVNRRKN